MTPLRPYENESPAPISRRFFAFCIDAIILLVTHFLLLLAANAILQHTKTYQSEHDKLQDAMAVCYRMQEESRITAFPSEGEGRYAKPMEQEEYFHLWLDGHIVRSYEMDSTPFEDKGIASLGIKTPAASYETDHLAYFYVTFLPENNERYGLLDVTPENPKQSYHTLLKGRSYFYGNEPLWDYGDESLPLPTLKPKFAAELHYYLKTDSSYQSGLAIYNLLARSYQDVWDVENKMLVGSKEYAHQQELYLNSYRTLSAYVDLSGFLCYVASFLSFLLPQLILPTHQTLGRKIIKVLTVDSGGYPILPWQIGVRNLVAFFGFFGLTAVTNFLAGGGNSAWVFPIFAIGPVQVSVLLVCIILLILLFLSFLTSVFTLKKQGLPELCSNTYDIDLRYFTPHDEGNDLVAEEEEKASAEDASGYEVVDSTTIRRD